jgi:hypothetical protein
MAFAGQLSPSIKAIVPPPIVGAYAVFASASFAVYFMVAGQEFSSILTMSVMVQCLSIVFLLIQVQTSSGVGISLNSLKLDALSIVLRLSSTTWLNGYLPVDASGDHIYQLVDIASLVLILALLHRLHAVQQQSHQASDDTFPVFPLVLSSLILAAMLHADMDDRPLFDTLWMAGLFTGVVAVLPQLWIVTRAGGKVEALTSHYIAAMALSRVLSGAFMWHARHDITCSYWIDGVNHAIWAIIGAHLAHLVLLGDFAFCYARAMMRSGPLGSVDLVLPLWV